MAAQDKTTLKSYFNTGDYPTETQFAEFIDSYPNIVDGEAVLRRRATLSVVANNVELNWGGANDLISTNRVAISANATISYANVANAEIATFKIQISNLATLTFPAGSVSPDMSWSALVWTPAENGNFTISIYRTGTEYEVIFTQAAAV